MKIWFIWRCEEGAGEVSHVREVTSKGYFSKPITIKNHWSFKSLGKLQICVIYPIQEARELWREHELLPVFA